MVSHVAYHEVHCRDAEECISAICDLLHLGWNLSQIRGRRNGPFSLIFRMDDVSPVGPS
jgi:hypothetical protein